MKIICAGYPKTGTKTMREVLEILGYENNHDILEQISIDHVVMNKALLKENATIDDIKTAYANVDSIMDVPAIFMWEKIFEAFPESKVILTVRDDPNAWLKSYKTLLKADSDNKFQYDICKALFSNRFCPNFRNFTLFYDYITQKTSGGAEYRYHGLTDKAQLGYVQHNANVIKTCPEDKLLVYNVKEGWEPLCKFLGKKIPKQNFPRKNTGHSVVDDFWNNTFDYDDGLISKMRREMIRLTIIVIIFIIIILFLLYFWQ